MAWYIAGGIAVLLIGYIIYGFYKVKNIKDVPASKKIKILNNKNFKAGIRKGLILVDFWAPWCAPCKMIAPTLNELAEEEHKRLSIGKVNVDQNQAIARKYKIRNIPTMILFRDGRELKRFTGVKTKKFLLKECEI